MADSSFLWYNNPRNKQIVIYRNDWSWENEL